MSTTLIPPALCIAYILPIWPSYLEQHPLGRSSASTKVSIPRRLLLDIIRRRRRPNDDLLHQRSASRIFMPQHPAVRQSDPLKTSRYTPCYVRLPNYTVHQPSNIAVLSSSRAPSQLCAFSRSMTPYLSSSIPFFNVCLSRKEQDC